MLEYEGHDCDDEGCEASAEAWEAVHFPHGRKGVDEWDSLSPLSHQSKIDDEREGERFPMIDGFRDAQEVLR